MITTNTRPIPAGAVVALAVLGLTLLACSGTAGVAPTAVPKALPTVVATWTVSLTPVSLPTEVSPTPAETVTPLLTTAMPTSSKVGSVAASNANLRGGPGTDFAIVGGVKQGQALEVVGRNAAGDWLLLADGAWIAARLVNGVGEVSVVASPAQPTAQSVRAATVQVASVCECSADLYNCDDFKLASDAQKCYEFCKQQTGKDVHGLDRDSDGLACEFKGW